MKYINTYENHSSYDEKLNGGGWVDISLPNVSYCEDVKDVHYNPYNTVEFYVGEITSPETVKISTDIGTSVDVQVSEGNKWYTYVLPKDKGLYRISNRVVKKVVVKADISYKGGNQMYPPESIIPISTIEASFKGSNISKETNIYGMFGNCSGLTSLDLRNFNTSNVTDMNHMFIFCSHLTSLDVSSFDTSNVTHMNSMFENCYSLTSLDLSSFDTSNVTKMSDMFYNCASLTSLDLSSFDTSKVTNMMRMFNGCRGLTSLNLSNFKTSNVTDMESMFSGCSGLTSLDLSGWNTSNVTSMSNMFKNCNSLTTIRMVGCSEATINKIKAVKPSSATVTTE